MLASIPVNEMAETLRVLAGANAANAARHFTKRSYDMGDVSSAVLWTSIAQFLGAGTAPAEPAPEMHSAAAETMPLDRIREGVVMQGVRYEDVDGETLAREERETIAIRLRTRGKARRAPADAGDGVCTGGVGAPAGHTVR